VRDDFKHSSERIAGFENLVDFFFHALFGFGVRAVEQDFFLLIERKNLLPCDFMFESHSANRNHVAENLDTELMQEEFGQGSDGNARGGFTR